MAYPTKQPLIDFVIGTFMDQKNIIEEDKINDIKDILIDYIDKRNYNYSKSKLLEIVSNPSLIDKIRIILDIPDYPIPEFITLENKTYKNRKKTRTWSTEEDFRLVKGIHKLGLENWNEVSKYVGNGRTRSQCSQRWIRVLDPRIVKINWTQEEDIKLNKLVQIHGEKCWAKISHLMGNRSDVQCRYRYSQIPKNLKNIDIGDKETSVFPDLRIWPIEFDSSFLIPQKKIQNEEQISLSRNSRDVSSSDKLFDSSFWFY